MQLLCFLASVPCVSCAKLVRQPCSWNKARFQFYLSFWADKLCKFCAGIGGGLSCTLDRLCESCAASVFEQDLCGFALVPVCGVQSLCFKASELSGNTFSVLLKLLG